MKTYSIYVSTIPEKWGYDFYKGDLTQEQALSMRERLALKYEFIEIR